MTWYRTLLAGAFVLTACQTQQSGDEQSNRKENGPAPLHLGAVHQVFPDQGFATLRFIGPVPPAGSTLITHPPDGTNSRVGNLQLPANLQVRNSYVVASIRSGVVFQGDRVFLYRNVAPNQTAASGNSTGDILPLPGDGSQLGTPDAGSLGTIASPAATSSAMTAVNPVSAGVPSSPAAPDSGYLQPLPDHQPEEVPVQPAAQPVRKPAASGSVPAYLNDIPDNINDWD